MDTFRPAVVIDDSAVVGEVVSNMLRACGFKSVSAASSGTEGIGTIRLRMPGLVLCDVNMPEVCGVEVLRTVRNDPVLRHTCFMLMTTMRHRDVIDAAMHFQADGFILKPFSFDVLKCKLMDVPKLRLV